MTPSSSVPLDGVAPPAPSGGRPSATVKRWKGTLLFTLLAAYVVYGGWSIVMLALLPSNDPALNDLPIVVLLVALVVGAAFLGAGALILQRIALSKTDPRHRMVALAKAVAAVLPAILLSVATPLLAMRELPIAIDITSPQNVQDLVAPISMTFNVERALPGLAAAGFVPVQYRWDVNADRKVDQETTAPELTATFEQQGSFAVTVLMVAGNGQQRSATKRFLIRRSVFKITPDAPIVNQPAVFSLAHLYPPEGAVREVQWDFNEDGEADITSPSLEATHTFFRTDTVTVRAAVALTNNTQTSFERVVTITEAPPLPFPATLSTEPRTLIGSPPFPVLFSVATDEPVGKIEWDFGDGSKGEGQKIAHTFDKKGTFPVNVQVHSRSGAVSILQTMVRMVDVLRLADLTFEGTPAVAGGRIEGEVPLSLNITPRTGTPFIQFEWEAPEATEVGSTETSLQAIYRREGTYTVTLVAQDLEDHVLRMPITIVVKPASSSLTIAMDPETGVAPLAVKFDASESFIPGETITGFVWNFGDDSTEEFGGARSEHTFTKEGTYTIGLTVRTTSGKTYSTRKTLVVREPLLRACITPSRIRGTAPLGVDFSSACTVGTPDTYLWDFGDGAQSDQKNIIHVFEGSGTYTVSLTVKEGTSSHTSTVLITAQP